MNKEELSISHKLWSNTKSHNTIMKDLVTAIVNYVENDFQNSLLEAIDSSGNKFRKEMRRLDLKNNDDMKDAYYLGFIKAAKDIKTYKDNQLKKSNTLNSFFNKTINKRILILLYKENIVSNKEVQQKLEIETGRVEEILNYMEEIEIVKSKIYNRERFYFLTENGKEAYRLLCENNENISIEKYSLYLMEVLDLIYDFLEVPSLNKEAKLIDIFNSNNRALLLNSHSFNNKLRDILDLIEVNYNNMIYKYETTSAEMSNIREENFLMKFNVLNEIGDDWNEYK